MATTIHHRTCNLCEAICGLEIEHDGSQILSIKGDKQDPFSRGHVCPKAVALKDIHEDPDRLRQPLKKVDGQWQSISWDQALDEVAEKLGAIQQAHGKDSVGVYLGNPNVHNTGSMLFSRHLLHALNTRNRFSATSVDQLPHHLIAHKLFGHQLKIPVPDIDHCDYFLVFGANPMASNGSIMTVPDVRHRLKAINQRGGKIVVIDPRRSETAEVASEHLFVRPGSDALLLSAMIHDLYASGKVATHRLHDHTDELEGLEAQFSPFSPEAVAEATGISALEIRRLVSEFTSAKNAVAYGRMGVSVHPFGTLSQYLIMLFNLLCGRLDEPGGLMFTRPAIDTLSVTGPGNFDRSRSRVRQLPAFSGEYPVATLAEEILTPGEGQIRALLTVAGNPVLSTPNGRQLDKALEQLDFMVCIDFYLNETSRHADIILPPVSPLEREHYDVIFHLLAVRNSSRYADALFEKPKDAKHDWEIFLALAERLSPARGLKQKFSHLGRRILTPKRTLDALLKRGPYKLSLKKLRAQPHGIDLGPLQPQLPEGLHHKDKRIHLNTEFFLSDLERLKTLLADTERHEQVLLIGRRHVRSNNSWLHNSQRLVKGKPRCTAQIHPRDAARMGVNEGQNVRITSRVGSLVVPAEVTDEIMPGVVSVPHGWGHQREGVQLSVAKEHAGVSVNDLTDEQAIDALSGNAALNALPVQLSAAS
ncbi:anaerobic selenocysteine-containing dehydrogenase [Litorivivens lipolytica]|uniref:Anaerobic selenocysteine-containing dehydrogenase n=1 Tax=Litorivivens lipolytica TaxID=1524264 RepID=A0A7W4W6H7_9GAMM|nr:molybdopterin oxidoreductase family protein [Litorivivens lipolytica]MBB3048398.1 anaerobic selenocysteine-containing dehydrogenase [Litorivivens lipolytica]